MNIQIVNKMLCDDVGWQNKTP